MAELYLVEFKGSRKEFYFNTYYHTLKISEHVITEAERGEDIGRVLKKVDPEYETPGDDRPKSILRRASDDDVRKMNELRQKEATFKKEAIEMIARHRLAMKVVDVECQFDNNKMTIYFTADHRVDFRELVKDLAARYRTRIELRQIGVRDEAKRIGGMGICGLQQCCNSFITEFQPISTQHAREQSLPLNPSKISGNCGRLLCCLRYEADMYAEVKRMFPPPGTEVTTEDGTGVILRIDIFSEEAIIRLEDSTVRARPKDILKVEKTGRKSKAASQGVAVEYEESTEEDEAGSKALED